MEDLVNEIKKEFSEIKEKLELKNKEVEELKEKLYKMEAEVKRPIPEVKEEKVDGSILVARIVKSLINGGGTVEGAIRYAEKAYKDEMLVKALNEGSPDAGGYLVFPKYVKDLIEYLRPKSVIRKIVKNVIPMNSNQLIYPKQTGGSSGYYIGEGVDIPETGLSFGQLVLTAKKMAALCPISNDLLRDASLAVDEIVRNDLVKAMAETEERYFLRGDGTGYTPKGLRYWADPGNVFAPEGSAYDAVIRTLARAELLLKKAYVNTSSAVWIISPRTEFFLKTLVNNMGNFVFRDEMANGKLHGYPYYVSHFIPENLGTNGNETEIYFVAADELIIAENEALIIDVSKEATYRSGTNLVSAYSLDQTIVRAIMRHDFAVRHEKAVVVINQVTWGA